VINRVSAAQEASTKQDVIALVPHILLLLPLLFVACWDTVSSSSAVAKHTTCMCDMLCVLCAAVQASLTCRPCGSGCHPHSASA
jgi:hypothetical protein